ncbi:MAG: NUDIX domain-containing protein [Desulfarculaceae bacterium]|jgi:8-oxo-dGTP pyrophosphatase MutT (NUDIX family)
MGHSQNSDKTNPKAKPSASVILLRPGTEPDTPFEILLLERQGKSRFMPGRFVFPGGRVESSDGQDSGQEPSLRTCALRELWEEAGVILATDPAKAAKAPPSEAAALREDIQKGGQGLAIALKRLGLSPDLEALTPFARWITPAARPQRFDTMFFLARMPPGQKASSDGSETLTGVWLSPERALAQNHEGKTALAPPQVIMLGELGQADRLEDLLAKELRMPLEPVRPFLWVKGDERVLLMPWDPDYTTQAPVQASISCPAADASRLVHVQGYWLPHRPRG